MNVTERGARPRAPDATSTTIPATWTNPPWNAAQCSRSAVCRSHSPTLLPSFPQAPWASASPNASAWWSLGAISSGSDVPTSRWSTSPRIRSSSQAISSSSSIERWSGSSTRAARESTTTSRAWVS